MQRNRINSNLTEDRQYVQANNHALGQWELDNERKVLPAFDKISLMYPLELSGGMAQRLTVVLALAANPELIILDEPTSGIDYTLINLTFLKLKEFVQQNDNAVLLVTQDWNFAEKISDFISLLSNGTLSEFLPANEFFKQEVTNDFSLINEFRNLNK